MYLPAACKLVSGLMQVTASATHRPDLLAAMRGAGTAFGVVVELTMKLHDVSGLYGGNLRALDDDSGSSFKCVQPEAGLAMPPEAVCIAKFSATYICAHYAHKPSCPC